MLSAPFYTEALYDGLKVEHFLHVAGNELANFVDNKHQGLARTPSFHQLVGALPELSR